MRIPSIILSLLLCITAGAKELGEWTHYFAHDHLTHVVPTNAGRVFALSTGRLFAYNVSDGSLEEYNTITGLNDYNDITDICYNRTVQRLVIAYSNGNIDMLTPRSGAIVNVPGIRQESTTNSKEILSLFSHGKYTYAVMNYGIVVLNADRQEVSDTYRLDTNGRHISGCTISGDSLFVSCNAILTGFKSNVISAALRDNLLDKNCWHSVTADKQQKMIMQIHDELQSRNIYDILDAGKKYSGKVEDTYNHCYWGSDDRNLLTQYSRQEDGTFAYASGPYRPHGPSSNDVWNIFWRYNSLYVLSHGIQTKTSHIMPSIIQMMNSQGDWNLFEHPGQEVLGHLFNRPNNITIDPRDTAHVFISGTEGLYEFISGKFIKQYNDRNSTLRAMNDGKSLNYQIVMGSAYDKNNRLWVLNSCTSKGLHSLDQKSPRDTNAINNIWQSYDHPELDHYKPADLYLAYPFFSSKEKLWFVNNHYIDPTFYSYDPWLDTVKEFTAKRNQDGVALYSTDKEWMRYITEDREGNIWIAGTLGIAYVPADNLDNAADGTVRQHKVSRDDGTGLADYLLKTVDATCIIFDSANRMYVSTMGNGVFIISPDLNTEEQHFLTDNSDLISNNVRHLALDEATGELYISTDRGLCSVRTSGIRVAESLDKSLIDVYPNPVAPDYTGPITIKGLPMNADIKITTATGAIVHTGRSAAGLYQWDGCDRNGNRVASGVYNILLASADGEDGCVAKVAIIK